MVEISVSFRVDFSPDCAVGPGKIALLEHISSTGSLSEAARKLKMSYRRAWLLLEDLNTSFQQPVAAAMSVGGRGSEVRLAERRSEPSWSARIAAWNRRSASRPRPRLPMTALNRRPPIFATANQSPSARSVVLRRSGARSR